MSPEAQRIAIAEACGWKIHFDLPKGGSRSIAMVSLRSPSGDSLGPFLDGYGWQGHLPNYLSDLNAMHEAEKLVLLQGDGWRERLERWSTRLMNVMHDSDFGHIDVAFRGDRVGLRYYTAHATASQRAEAFLKIIGKWDDSK